MHTNIPLQRLPALPTSWGEPLALAAAATHVWLAPSSGESWRRRRLRGVPIYLKSKFLSPFSLSQSRSHSFFSPMFSYPTQKVKRIPFFLLFPLSVRPRDRLHGAFGMQTFCSNACQLSPLHGASLSCLPLQPLSSGSPARREKLHCSCLRFSHSTTEMAPRPLTFGSPRAVGRAGAVGV